MAELTEEKDKWGDRMMVLEMDTSSDASVAAAAALLTSELGEAKLYAIVNNAGIGNGTISEILQTNVYGPHRVDAAFMPLLKDGGRIVQMSSGAGPRCVQTSSSERQKLFKDPNVTWQQITEVMDELLKCENTKQSLAAIGIGIMKGGPLTPVYGASKALLNCYTAQLARDHPQFKINSCSPGAINTELFKDAKCLCLLRLVLWSPDKGTRSTMHLLFGELEGNGCFYHKTATKRDFDKY
eukprot:CAMPEP_0197626010 /NCGR_PEP_ID=MMETSP1338-20131121/5181_1 /TAXON_ID=43686 ORGANISM="Pelagodinium beii, Strain RCC1491" /NCGR_SAMPLE_ID=MMETSP1338 /ASSEMBLY_ACC=CAM_ASM_000754 /LENGTH=239 /DNA_ID=CAMNT_0043196527 /DNA_START=218 /DNA_END=937 /DNA_ORIENTATION=+